MGLVLGRRGVVIQEIKVISGAQIQVSITFNFLYLRLALTSAGYLLESSIGISEK